MSDSQDLFLGCPGVDVFLVDVESQDGGHGDEFGGAGTYDSKVVQLVNTPRENESMDRGLTGDGQEEQNEESSSAGLSEQSSSSSRGWETSRDVSSTQDLHIRVSSESHSSETQSRSEGEGNSEPVKSGQ
jgi:hypothetical protein